MELVAASAARLPCCATNTSKIHGKSMIIFRCKQALALTKRAARRSVGTQDSASDGRKDARSTPLAHVSRPHGGSHAAAREGVGDLERDLPLPVGLARIPA